MKSPPKSPTCAAICIDTRDGAGRRRLRGVAEYAQQHGWRMMLVRQRGRDAAGEVLRLKPHGIITYIADQALVDAAARLRVPLVETAISEVDVPLSVSLDNHEVGRLAAESLTRLGFKHFAYCGVRGKRASTERQIYFAEHLAADGFKLRAFSQRIAEGESRMKPLINWLTALPKPVGILTFDDKLGERVLAGCHWSQFAVPDRVAVLGIGNDDLVSKLTWPSLSSINVPAEHIGLQAAGMLDRAMRRLTIKTPQRQILPTGVTLRGSTAALAVQDTAVESAARFIRDRAGEPISVDHVAEAVGVSRRTLDRRFAKALGRSVHEELAAVRMQNACTMLGETLATVGHISEACGFATAASFSRAFHREVGCWPVEYRNRVRG
ncbi:substrate-binding domain-containing protein [Planctomycetales bacterium ZRK34]|nr:substrate-binding domain-containing protein [Planctomycetales bacterium ZRK34]